MLEVYPIMKAKVYRCDYRDCKKKEVELVYCGDSKFRCGSHESLVRFSKEFELRESKDVFGERLEYFEGEMGVDFQLQRGSH